MPSYKPKRGLLSILPLLALSGCCLAPLALFTPVGVAVALFQGTPDIRDLGPEPTSYKQLVQAYMIPRLLDHASATYESWSGPGRTSLSDRDDGYVVYVTVNDKDASGNYSAPQGYEFVLRNDKIIACRKANDHLRYDSDCPRPAD